MVALAGMLVACFGAFAQQTPPQKIDSLEQWITNYPKQDTIRIKKMIELEFLYYSHSPNVMGKYADEMLELSKKLAFQKGVLRGLGFQVYALIFKGKYKEATQKTFEKLDHAKKYNNLSDVMDSYAQLAYIHSLSESSKEQSLKYFLKVKEIYEIVSKETPNYDQEVALNNNIATAYANLKDYKNSLFHQKQALKVF